jgi:hypothetical protein
MHDLSGGVHAGVGAACTDGLDRMAGDLAESTLENVLDRRATGLRLPAVERAAVVLEAERDPQADASRGPETHGAARRGAVVVT